MERMYTDCVKKVLKYNLSTYWFPELYIALLRITVNITAWNSNLQNSCESDPDSETSCDE